MSRSGRYLAVIVVSLALGHFAHPLGYYLNHLAYAGNGQSMPVWNIGGHFTHTFQQDDDHQALTSASKYWWLCDIIPTAEWEGSGYGLSMSSIGDLLFETGDMLVLFSIMALSAWPFFWAYRIFCSWRKRQTRQA